MQLVLGNEELFLRWVPNATAVCECMLSCTGRSDGGLQELVYSLCELFHLYLAMRVCADAHTHTGEERRGPSAGTSSVTE